MENENLQKIRKVLINKYAITLYVFAVIFAFIGEQSWVNQISRGIEMRKIRKSIEVIKAETVANEALLFSLSHSDSLERFAREKYRMHADDEVVFVVE